MCDESGEVKITPVGQTPLDHGLLDSDDAFILDMGTSGVYAWIGKGATQQERNQAFMHAQVGETGGIQGSFMPMSAKQEVYRVCVCRQNRRYTGFVYVGKTGGIQGLCMSVKQEVYRVCACR